MARTKRNVPVFIKDVKLATRLARGQGSPSERVVIGLDGEDGVVHSSPKAKKFAKKKTARSQRRSLTDIRLGMEDLQLLAAEQAEEERELDTLYENPENFLITWEDVCDDDWDYEYPEDRYDEDRYDEDRYDHDWEDDIWD